MRAFTSFSSVDQILNSLLLLELLRHKGNEQSSRNLNGGNAMYYGFDNALSSLHKLSDDHDARGITETRTIANVE